VAALNHSALLHTTSALNVVDDGQLNLRDARALERLGQAAVRDAKQSAGLVSSELNKRGRDLKYAAQQARYAVALNTPMSEVDTVHNALPTPRLNRPATPVELINQIKDIDVAALKAAGVKPIAAFDIDGTTIKGDIFLPFMELMAKKGQFNDRSNAVFTKVLGQLSIDPAEISPTDANKNALTVLSRVDPHARVDTKDKIGITTAFFTLGDAMVGQRVSNVRKIATELMEKGVGQTPPYKLQINDDSPMAGDGVRDVVGALRDAGIKPQVITYGYDWLARVAVPYVGFRSQDVIGTQSEVRGGVFTGAHNGRTIASKDQLVREAMGTPPLFAFGDSSSDLPMLDSAVARGVVINPSDSMRAKMQERNGRLAEVRYSTTVGDAGGTDAAPPA
jgi:phosphoserine phosphatase